MTTMKTVAAMLLALLGCAYVLRPQSTGHADRIHVVGLIRVKSGRHADFESLIARMAARTKKEDRGNIRYEFFRASAPLAASLRSDRISADYVFEEEWTDQQAVDAHLKWALPIVETEWKSLTDSTEFLRLAPVK